MGFSKINHVNIISYASSILCRIITTIYFKFTSLCCLCHLCQLTASLGSSAAKATVDSDSEDDMEGTYAAAVAKRKEMKEVKRDTGAVKKRLATHIAAVPSALSEVTTSNYCTTIFGRSGPERFFHWRFQYEFSYLYF